MPSVNASCNIKRSRAKENPSTVHSQLTDISGVCNLSYPGPTNTRPIKLLWFLGEF